MDRTFPLESLRRLQLTCAQSSSSSPPSQIYAAFGSPIPSGPPHAGRTFRSSLPDTPCLELRAAPRGRRRGGDTPTLFCSVITLANCGSREAGPQRRAPVALKLGQPLPKKARGYETPAPLPSQHTVQSQCGRTFAGVSRRRCVPSSREWLVFADVRDPEDACLPLVSAPRGMAEDAPGSGCVLLADLASNMRMAGFWHQQTALSLRPNAGVHHPGPRTKQ